MRFWLTRMLVGAVAVLSIGGGSVTAAALASPQHHSRPAARTAAPAASKDSADPVEETSGTNDAENDSAQQPAACQRAGVDQNGSNVQYDDQTGACSASGGGGGDQTQQ